jgi:hypothetical protein
MAIGAESKAPTEDIRFTSRTPTPTEEKKDLHFTELSLEPSVEQGHIIVGDEYSPAQYKRILRKIDRFLLPLMWFCYGVQQTDKTSLGVQAIFGLREDTGLVGQQYSWLTTVFYMTYMIGEFPSNFLLQKWSLGKSLSIYMICWGEADKSHRFISLLDIFADNSLQQVSASPVSEPPRTGPIS